MIDYRLQSGGCLGVDLSSADRLTRCLLEVRVDLLRFLKRRIDAATAEDVIQDVWVKLREHGNPQHWREPKAVVFAAAANLATDLGRHAAIVDRTAARESSFVDTTSVTVEPEACAEASNRLERIFKALESLPPLCRDAFLLNRFEALTHAQIAARLGISKKSAQRYIERALDECLQADKL
jgi:RNA polymerase sigma factor (sigma-70 family)